MFVLLSLPYGTTFAHCSQLVAQQMNEVKWGGAHTTIGILVKLLYVVNASPVSKQFEHVYGERTSWRYPLLCTTTKHPRPMYKPSVSLYSRLSLSECANWFHHKM